MNVTGTRDSLSARLSQNNGTSMCHSLVPLCFSVMPPRTQKSPHCIAIQWGLVFFLFYSFLFVLIAFAIAALCRHSSLLLYKIEPRTTLSPAISRLHVETAPLAPPFQNRAQPAFPSLLLMRVVVGSFKRENIRG